MGKGRLERVRDLAIQAILTVTLTFLMSSVSIITAYSKHDQPRYPFIFTTINIWIEISKMVVSLMLYAIERIYYRNESKHTPLFLTPIKSLNFLVPAVIYAIRNNAYIYLLLFIAPTTAEVVGQVKIIMTALCMWIMLLKKFSSLQWFAVVVVGLGASISVFDCNHPLNVKSAVGILLVIFNSYLSVMAGVYTEWRIKENKEDSLNVQNIHMYFWGSIVSCIIFLIYGLKEAKSEGFFVGYSIDVFWIVFVNVLQGLLSSIVMKYINNIARVFSHTLSMIVVIGLSPLVLNMEHELSSTFLLGAAIVITGMIQYNHQTLVDTWYKKKTEDNFESDIFDSMLDENSNKGGWSPVSTGDNGGKKRSIKGSTPSRSLDANQFSELNLCDDQDDERGGQMKRGRTSSFRTSTYDYHGSNEFAITYVAKDEEEEYK